MSWKEVEQIFNRALQFTFSRKKFLFIFPVLMICGLIIVLCRALAFIANSWVAMSLAFLPVFLCSAIFLFAGIVLIRIYHHEVKALPISYRRTVRQSMELMAGIAYLCVPLLLAYLLLWTALGIFFLLKEIPSIGNTLGFILSFGPFLLVLGSFLLSLLNLIILFFVTPAVSLKTGHWLSLAEELWQRAKSSAFSHIAFFFIGNLPLVLMVALSVLSAIVTGKSYIEAGRSLSVAVQWFFIMLPFSALLSFFVIFFFNFAAESHVLLQRKWKQVNEEKGGR
ncbi:MAG TPA: hypothetical protein VJ112_01280 [Rhabdochlamydiaceae bacterium]|nr:hypothetical protein [Rhabdochlamydiaceae bacterium]